MIAKVPRKRLDGRSTFRSLIAYVLDSASAVICGEAILSAATAASEMNIVAGANTRCKDPVYHYILSWPEPERPSDDQAAEAVRATLEKLGFIEHQWVGAIHRNTGHVHMHVAVNRVHPESLRVASPRGDWLILDRACRELEMRQGWRHDCGPHAVVRKSGSGEIIRTRRVAVDGPTKETSKARDFSAWTGLDSFQKWIAGEPARQLQLAIGKTPRSWQTVHDVLMGFNIEYRLKGTGAIVVDRDAPDKLCAKASHLGRFASRSRLEAILGPYKAPSQFHSAGVNIATDASERPGTSYTDATNRPIIDQSLRRYRVDPLYDRYRNDVAAWRTVGQPLYRDAWEAQRKRERDRQEALLRLNRRARTSIRRVRSAAGRRTLHGYQAWICAVTRQQLRLERSVERTELRARHLQDRPGTWPQWLRRRAEVGDELAIRRLRRIRLHERRQPEEKRPERIGFVSSELAPALGRIDGYRVVVRRDGLDYHLRGRLAFRDAGRQVAIHEKSEDAIGAALLLAREKWGRSLSFSGSHETAEAVRTIADRFGIALGVSDTETRLSRTLVGHDPGRSEFVAAAPQDAASLAVTLGKPVETLTLEAGRRYTGKIVAIFPASDGKSVVVLDLGRRLGAVRLPREALANVLLRVGERAVAQGSFSAPTAVEAEWRIRPEREIGRKVDRGL